MRIAVFGTGEVGSAVVGKLKALEHDIVFGSRHPGDDKDGIPRLDHHAAASHAEIAVNAIHGEDALKVLPTLPLVGKLLWDIGNFQSAIDGPIVETPGRVVAARTA